MIKPSCMREVKNKRKKETRRLLPSHGVVDFRSRQGSMAWNSLCKGWSIRFGVCVGGGGGGGFKKKKMHKDTVSKKNMHRLTATKKK